MRQVLVITVCGDGDDSFLGRMVAVSMVSDANAARYDEDHAAGLTSFYQSFGDVRATGEVLNNVIAATPVK